MNWFKGIIKKIIDLLGIDLSKSLFFQAYKNRQLLPILEKQINILIGTNQLYIDKYLGINKSKDLLSIVCFSFDRAFQLDALLGSFYDNVKDAQEYEMVIYYRCSNETHKESFELLKKAYPYKNIRFIEQQSKNSFREDVMGLVEKLESEKVMFLVDDIVFIEKVDLREFANLDSSIFTPSLRLGLNTIHCYMEDKPQSLPAFDKYTKIVNNLGIKDTYVWKWEEGEKDWKYMVSVDGNIYDRREYLIIMKNCDFKSPNTLEANIWYFYKDLYMSKLGICYSKSKILNMPVNHVMQDKQIQEYAIDNRFGDIHQDYLLEQWLHGKRMDYKKLYGYNNKGVHEEISFEIINR
jgi:hypothetical protein